MSEPEKTTSPETSAQAFYTAQGKCRYTLVIGKEQRAKLLNTCAEFSLSQGDVLGALIDHFDMEKMAPVFRGMREEKVGGRMSKSALVRRLAKASPDELREIEEILKAKREESQT